MLLTVVVVDGNEVSELQVTVILAAASASMAATYPASELASEETPSWRHPSPKKAIC